LTPPSQLKKIFQEKDEEMGERQGTETREKRQRTKDKGQRTLRLQEVKILGL
jgi:hypothetical protein